MSHRVMISYDSLTIQVKAQCDEAIRSLCQIDKVLDRIHNTAKKLETKKVKEYERYLNNSKNIINNKITEFKEYLDTIKYKQDDYDIYYNKKREINSKAKELMDIVNDLTGSKLTVIDQMINEGLLNVGTETIENLQNKMNGILSMSKSKLDKINGIEDISLRELVYREYIKNENLSYEEAFNKGKKEYDKLLNKQAEKIIDEYKEELKTKGISTEILNDVENINDAKAIASEALINENIRKETLKVIIKAIKSRGFIVDTKKNLKIDRETNILKLVAQKASGQIAEFEIQLNGKFMYHFEGYEGLACNQDITPFMEDLRNIYDINVLHEDVQWSNPDKIQTKKYQYVNKNKGRN